MKEFHGRILMVGYGAVAQCSLPILLKTLKVNLSQITVMDFEDRSAELAPYTAQGLKFVKDKVAENNLASLLSSHATAGDILIDLAWNIDCCEILQWCHSNGVRYLNTSVEVWDPYRNAETAKPQTRTLYHRHMNVRKLIASWGSKKGPTAVLEHGANPGLISHWTRHGLLEIGNRLIADKKVEGARLEKIREHSSKREFNLLAETLGVKVIHCSERDTQITSKPKRIDEFVNTWSVEGFREEGTTTAEMGWGTHEKELPAGAYLHESGPQNQICLARMGMNTWVRSWVPNYDIYGMVVRHGEAFTISDSLTVWRDGKAAYRPTVHYAYCPSDSAIASLNEMRGNNYKLQSSYRILNDEIDSGADVLGALIMGHDYQSWWVGSILTIEESRRLVPHQNATTMQVAASVIAAVAWMVDNPEAGVCVPDDLPHEYILNLANPYLGEFVSTSADWTPLKRYQNAFQGFHAVAHDANDPWQFKNFLVQE